MFMEIEEGKKIAFQDTETKEFKVGRIMRVLSKKESEVKTEDGNTIVVRNKKMRTIKAEN